MNNRLFSLMIFVVFVSFALLSSCTDDIESESQGSKGILYEVSGGENEVYLFGSIHFGVEDMYPLHEDVIEAFDISEVLVTEVDLSRESDVGVGNELAQRGMYEFEEGLMTEVVSPSLFNETLDILRGYGIDETSLEHMRPWYAEMMLAEEAIINSGYDPELGIESYFLRLAEERSMPMIGIEDPGDQIAPYELLSEESQVLRLERALDERQDVDENLGALISDWKRGRVENSLEERRSMLNDDETPSLEDFGESILIERDANMAQEIDSLLQDDSGNTYFVVVGYPHLVGEGDIVDNLRDMSYDVKRIE